MAARISKRAWMRSSPNGPPNGAAVKATLIPNEAIGVINKRAKCFAEGDPNVLHESTNTFRRPLITGRLGAHDARFGAAVQPGFPWRRRRVHANHPHQWTRPSRVRLVGGSGDFRGRAQRAVHPGRALTLCGDRDCRWPRARTWSTDDLYPRTGFADCRCGRAPAVAARGKCDAARHDANDYHPARTCTPEFGTGRTRHALVRVRRQLDP